MKKYILFENKGLLEVMALFMIGASTKRDDPNKIGRFGSGFKYSLAKILRDKLDIRIFSGEDEIKVATVPFTLRDKEFQAITVNGMQTSLTTDMGPDWKWWQIVRELWCNALDEGQADTRKIEDEALIYGKADYTRVFLEMNEDIEAVVNEWDVYFAQEREDMVLDTPDFKVYRANNNKQLYYRMGIRCHNSDMPALFHYDHAYFNINEERVLVSEWQASYQIGTELGKHATFEMAQTILRNAHRDGDNKPWEHDICWEYANLSQTWKHAAQSFDAVILANSAGHYIDKAKNDNYALVSNSLAKKLIAIGAFVYGVTPDGKPNEWHDVPRLTPKQEFLLNDTVAALQSNLGYEMKYPIKIVEFDSEHTLGRAEMDTKTILLSPKLFDMGRRKIALVLMEEQEHIYNKLADETRDFQNHLFSKWLATMEEKAGFFF